jgi:septum formation protein
MTLLLASRSAARRHMLEAAGVPFEIRVGDSDEEKAKDRLRRDRTGAPGLARALAEFKAMDVEIAGDALVLGADQMLECDDGAMLDKPRSPQDLAEQLHKLSGRTHHLHSAGVIVQAGAVTWSDVESVALTVRPLSEAFIAAYVEQEYEIVRFSVGGYRIEGPGVQLFERIEGSHFAILGLPLLPLLGYLREREMLPR